MPFTMSARDSHRPLLCIGFYTLAALGMFTFGAFTLFSDLSINGLDSEHITQYYGGPIFLLLFVVIGLFFIWYIYHNIRVIIARTAGNNQNQNAPSNQDYTGFSSNPSQDYQF